MRVEVPDVPGRDAGITEGRGHAARGAFAVLAGRGHVERIRRRAKAGKLAIDARPAGLRVFVFLQQQHAGAVAQHEAVATGIPRPRGGLRIVVAGAHRLHRAEAPHRCRRAAAFGTAGDHGVGIAMLDHAHRHADRMVRCRAGGHRGEVGALDAGEQAHLARQHVDDGAGHVERADLAQAAFVELDGGFLDAPDAADARPQQRPDALGVGVGHLEAGVFQRHQRGCHAVMDEVVHLLRVLRVHPAGDVEVADLAGNARRIGAGVEPRHHADSRAAVDDAIPVAGKVVAQRRDDAHPGDHDAPVR